MNTKDLKDIFLEDSRYFIDILKELEEPKAFALGSGEGSEAYDSDGTKDDYQLYLEGKIYCNNYETCYYDIIERCNEHYYSFMDVERSKDVRDEIKQYIEENVCNDKRGYLINLRDKIKDSPCEYKGRYLNEYTEAVNKGNPRALLNLGGYYKNRGEDTLALKYYKEAWKKYNYIPALYKLAVFYKMKGFMNTANQKLLLKSEKYCLLAINNNYFEVYSILIDIFWNLKDCDKCAQYYAEILARNIEISGNIRSQLAKILGHKYIELNKRNKELEEENTHLRYKPGGVGMKEAKEHFEALLNN